MNKMKEEKMGKARIGVFSVGYDKYWSQFPGLLDELLKKEAEFIRKIPVEEVEVFSFGMVDSPAVAYEKVKEIGGIPRHGSLCLLYKSYAAPDKALWYL